MATKQKQPPAAVRKYNQVGEGGQVTNERLKQRLIAMIGTDAALRLGDLRLNCIVEQQDELLKALRYLVQTIAMHGCGMLRPIALDEAAKAAIETINRAEGREL